MDRRKELHDKLVEILPNVNIYFQPPESFKLTYPCLVYQYEVTNVRRADNGVYKLDRCYNATYIHRDPDDYRAENIMIALPKTKVGNRYVSDNLYHDPLTIYY